MFIEHSGQKGEMAWITRWIYWSGKDWQKKSSDVQPWIWEVRVCQWHMQGRFLISGRIHEWWERAELLIAVGWKWVGLWTVLFRTLKFRSWVKNRNLQVKRKKKKKTCEEAVHDVGEKLIVYLARGVKRWKRICKKEVGGCVQCSCARSSKAEWNP